MSVNRKQTRQKQAKAGARKTNGPPPGPSSGPVRVKSPSPGGAAPTHSRKLICLIMLVIAIAALAAYSNLYRNEFIDFDDNLYITENLHVQNGLSPESIRWAFNFQDKGGNYWQPVTWLSIMACYRLFGPNGTAFHLVNLFIHILNALLLFYLLVRLTGSVWPSALVAFLFALHPLNVESVAWAAEIKTVLSTFFGLSAVHAYVSYIKRRNGRRYAAVLILFCLSLMSKVMFVTLPFVLLLLDWWPLGRVVDSNNGEALKSRIKDLVLKKAPLLALSEPRLSWRSFPYWP